MNFALLTCKNICVGYFFYPTKCKPRIETNSGINKLQYLLSEHFWMIAPYVTYLSSKDLKKPLLTLRYNSLKKLWKPMNGFFYRLISRMYSLGKIQLVILFQVQQDWKGWVRAEILSRFSGNLKKLIFKIEERSNLQKLPDFSDFFFSYMPGYKLPWGIAINRKWHKIHPISLRKYYYLRTTIKCFLCSTDVSVWR